MSLQDTAPASFTPSPAWATEIGPWGDGDGEYRIASRTEHAAGHKIALDGVQEDDGRVTEVSLGLDCIDGRVLADPVADILETALALIELADKFAGDDREGYEAAMIRALGRRAGR